MNNFNAENLKSLDYAKFYHLDKKTKVVLAEDNKGNIFELITKDEEIKNNIFPMVHIGTKLNISGEIVGTNFHPNWSDRKITIVVKVSEITCTKNIRKVV